MIDHNEQTQYIIPILSPSELDYDLEFNLHSKMIFDLNINIEYEKMLVSYGLKTKGEPIYKTVNVSSVYYRDEESDEVTERHNGKLVLSRNGNDFVPFYIIRTMDYMPDSKKIMAINHPPFYSK